MMDSLIGIISQNSVVHEILTRAPKLNIKNYYIGAGCITQSVWNCLSGMPPEHGVKDIDFVYFDEDLTEQSEGRTINRIKELYRDLSIDIDVKNQARVHLWYRNRFGYDITPYRSLEAAIDTWPTTATAIGVRKTVDEWTVYAPFGLDDLFGMIVRANKVQITQAIYEAKVARWLAIWPNLRVIPWESQQV
jgi:hypothetical protein